jgi:hypothetical protein
MGYTFDQILQHRPSDAELAKPLKGLLYIVVQAPVAATVTAAKRSRGGGGGGHRNNRAYRGDDRDDRNRKQYPPSNRGGTGGGGGGASPKVALAESETSFSATRRRGGDQSESTKLIGEMRVMLNKVTDENMNLILSEAKDVCCPKLQALIDTFETNEEQDALLTQLAKLFVQKAQVDHAFSKWYAQIASELALPYFGDILYEVCRDVIPEVRYDPEDKRKYLGALLLLVELKRFGMVDLICLEGLAGRLFLAAERNMGNVVMGTAKEGEAPIDSSAQIEVCIELLCRYLSAFFELEKPEQSVVDEYLQQLKAFSINKDQVKARSRFLLTDFFDGMKKKNLL